MTHSHMAFSNQDRLLPAKSVACWKEPFCSQSPSALMLAALQVTNSGAPLIWYLIQDMFLLSLVGHIGLTGQVGTLVHVVLRMSILRWFQRKAKGTKKHIISFFPCFFVSFFLSFFFFGGGHSLKQSPAESRGSFFRESWQAIDRWVATSGLRVLPWRSLLISGRSLTCECPTHNGQPQNNDLDVSF